MAALFLIGMAGSSYFAFVENADRSSTALLLLVSAPVVAAAVALLRSVGPVFHDRLRWCLAFTLFTSGAIVPGLVFSVRPSSPAQAVILTVVGVGSLFWLCWWSSSRQRGGGYFQRWMADSLGYAICGACKKAGRPDGPCRYCGADGLGIEEADR